MGTTALIATTAISLQENIQDNCRDYLDTVLVMTCVQGMCFAKLNWAFGSNIVTEAHDIPLSMTQGCLCNLCSHIPIFAALLDLMEFWWSHESHQFPTTSSLNFPCPLHSTNFKAQIAISLHDGLARLAFAVS